MPRTKDADIAIVETETAWRPYLGYRRKQWRELGPITRLKLTHRDFKAIRGKYKGGMALPIFGENRTVIGVVAIDLSPDSELSFDCLLHDDIARSLQQAAEDIQGLISVKG